jgi:endonuclease/exonuclease/phosphatase (EEP) superfamily protein YafD
MMYDVGFGRKAMMVPCMLHKFGRACKHVLVLGAVLYFTLLPILVVLWTLLPEDNSVLALTNIFAPYLFAPLAVLLPLALLLRLHVLFWPGVGLLVLAGALFVPAMLPTAPRPETQPVLRVATFNQLYSNSDVEGTLAVLLRQDADIIALQELSYPVQQALDELEQRYPYRVLQPHHLPGGLGIVSRYPITQVESLEGIRALRAIVQVDGQPITLINVHPSPPNGLALVRLPFTQLHLPTYDPSRRNEQLAHLLPIIPTIEGPLIVAGDLNTADREQMYQRFAALLHDAHSETAWGPGYTYSNHGWVLGHTYAPLLPRVRLDYIWSSGGLVPVAAHTSCEVAASDHCMVVADLGWQSTP